MTVLSTIKETEAGMRQPPLQRDVGAVEIVGTTVSMMAPTFSMAVAVPFVAVFAGRLTPISFLIAGTAIACVAVPFTAYSRRIVSAGSVFAFIGASVGERLGFLTAWLLLLGYTLGAVFSAVGTSGLLLSLFAPAGETPLAMRVALELCILAGLAACSLRRLLNVSRLLLGLEMLGVGAILAFSAIIVAKATSSAPAPVRAPLPPVGIGGVLHGAVIAVLYFSGFESAAALGEESTRPKRAIPLAMGLAIVIALVTYMAGSYAQVTGFGPAGLATLTSDASPLATLLRRFLSPASAAAFDVIAALSAFACALAGVVTASRMVYAMGRHYGLARLTAVNGQGVPVSAALAVLGSVALLAVLSMTLLGFEAGQLLAISGATLCCILMYLAVCAVFLRDGRQQPAPLILGALAGVAVMVVLLVSSLDPWPDGAAGAAPVLVALWGILGVVVSRHLRSRQTCPIIQEREST